VYFVHSFIKFRVTEAKRSDAYSQLLEILIGRAICSAFSVGAFR